MSIWKVGFVASFDQGKSISDSVIVEGGIQKAVDVALLSASNSMRKDPDTVSLMIWKVKEKEK